MPEPLLEAELCIDDPDDAELVDPLLMVDELLDTASVPELAIPPAPDRLPDEPAPPAPLDEEPVSPPPQPVARAAMKSPKIPK